MITGTVFTLTETTLGTIQIETATNYNICKVFVGGEVVIQIPLEKTLDTNAIAIRLAVVVQQTGLVDKPVRIELNP